MATIRTAKTATARRDFTFYIARATAAMNNGFTSKQAQKDAMADVTRAYELARGAVMEACLNDRFEVVVDGHPQYDMKPEVNAVYWGLPSYPHQFKAKHVDMVTAAFGSAADLAVSTTQMTECAELRDVIKAQPVVAPVRNAEVERTARISKSILDLMARRGEQYNKALDLGEVFTTEFGELAVSLPVTANVHSVTNEHGTTFLRAFYYLRGEFTPLNVIMAAAGELIRQAKEG